MLSDFQVFQVIFHIVSIMTHNKCSISDEITTIDEQTTDCSEITTTMNNYKKYLWTLLW